MKKLQLLIAFTCTGWAVNAQEGPIKTSQLDEVVVTGTKSEIPVEKSGKSIFKLTRKDIEESGNRSVSDLLNHVPGVQMDGNFGPLGTNIGYFIRGASSKRTLILIDGIPFNDASGVNQTYDLRLLDLSQVESIEILKGGLSTLYGTGAAAGVINITLKESSKEKTSGGVGLEYGSFNTMGGNLNVSQKIGGFNYLVNAGYKKSDGFSAALDKDKKDDFDDDGFKGFNLLSKIGYQFSDSFSLTFTGALDDYDYDYDKGAFSDAKDYTGGSKQWRYGVSSKLNLGEMKISTNIFLSKLNRLFDTPRGFTPKTEYDADNIQADILVDQTFTEDLKLIGGLNYQKLSYTQPSVDKVDFNMIDPYLSFIYSPSDFTVQVGGRLNQHSEYGPNFVYNINPSYLITVNSLDLKLFSSYSTSFIAPSLSQLFGPFGANTKLKTEESQSMEGGVSLYGHLFKVEALYYRREDNDLIIYGAKGYENAGKEIKTDGIELSGRLDLSDKLRLTGHYTYVRFIDDAVRFRIPQHKYGVSLDYRPTSNLLLKPSYLYTGDRKQPFYNSDTFLTEEVQTASFDLIDFFVSYQIKKLTVSATMNNILDKDYIGIYGYTTVGRNYKAGVRYNFN